ncbi:uncharacterized protein LOC131161448 [Malania oleifera]|uniref:uncharacterized protein LOC131161448 n=1 Tax=Malania oleifera TaxID=397392 RepID=UPI0025AE9B9C|nr:uncharacterized protein LOC131161448 [Malania oleifera]
MTLEDFFTLTEMKDGLTAPARVEELVNVMQKERDCVVKNVGDATRQWSTVASTIAATENRDCLDLFIQLDGLWFIDRWLKDAQKFSKDTSDGFVEESMTALLRALERLHMDNERSISSEIWITIKNLLGHSNSAVQDRARALFDSWNQSRNADKVHHDEKVGESHDAVIADRATLAGGSSLLECSAKSVPLSKQSSNMENHAGEPACDDILPSRNTDDPHPEKVEDVKIQTSNNQVRSHMTSDSLQVEDGPSVPSDSSLVLKSVGENFSAVEETAMRPGEGGTSIDTCSSPATKQDKLEEKSVRVKLNEVLHDANQTYEMEISAAEVIATEISSASDKLDAEDVSLSADAVDASDSVIEPLLQNKIDAKDGGFCQKPTSHGELNTESKSEMNHFNSTAVFQTTGEGGECYSSSLQDSSGSESMLRKNEDPGTLFSQMEDIEAVDEVKGQGSGRGEDVINASDCLKPPRDMKKHDVADMELEYGLVDALELARQVAQEVEREVVDYKEPFCSSSSEKTSEGGVGQPGSPDSINGNDDQFTEGPLREAPSGRNLSADASPKGEDHFINSDNPDTEPENCIPDMESSQVTEAAQEPQVILEKGLCDFDLNQDVCCEDMDHPVNPSTATVSVVSASRPVAAPGLPAAPLQFEGTLGWKGSAATSAFRPASPRRISDGDKYLCVGGSSNSSKQRQDFLDIDLNVAEGADDETGDVVVPEKQIPLSSSLPSVESSVEVSPRRSERLNLDLNRISDEGDALPSDGRTEARRFYPRNGHQSPSPASSSSSMPPAMRNIDLNDPTFCNDSSDYRPRLGKPMADNVNTYGGPKLDDPGFSLMGKRLEVSRKDFPPQSLSVLQNGRAVEPAIDPNLTRVGGVLDLGPAVPYSHPPVYGFNSLPAGPSMSFSSAMYGPGGSIPYMMDSRGAHVVPQIVASASAIPPSYTPQPSFIMSMTGATPGLNGAGPSRPSFDLNSSGFFVEGGSRDLGGLRQLFSPGDGRLVDEHLRAYPQSTLSSAGIGEKRKEPDGGWESYPFSNKQHQQPPWR